MKCSDCGQVDNPMSARLDICTECFGLRGKLLDAVKIGLVHMDEFRELQRVIGRHNGQAANAIRRAIGEEIAI